MNSYTKKLEEENRLLQQKVIELERIIEKYRKPITSEDLAKLIERPGKLGVSSKGLVSSSSSEDD